KHIQGIILLTLLPLAGDIRNHSLSSFELFGFDVLLDYACKPWLLEANLSPALGLDSPIDEDLKAPMLKDMVGLVGIGLDKKTAAPYVLEDSANRIKQESRGGSQRSSVASRASTPSTGMRGETIGSTARALPPKINLGTRLNGASVFPQKYGGFERIYPYDAFTQANGNAKVGDVAMKRIIANVTRRFCQ
ncbi:MAG: hypothetical protein SGCHY_005514, partial [Lobulomycetales sp.]